MAPQPRLAVLAFVSQSLVALAAPVTLTIYSDSACTTSESSTTTYELVSGCCYNVSDNGALLDTLSFECGSKAYTTRMTKLSYLKTGVCTGTPATQSLVSDYETALYKGQCVLYAATGKYHKLSEPLNDCIAQTGGQTCPDDGTVFSTIKNYSDAQCIQNEGTYAGSYWLAGTSPYCVVFNNNDTLQEYAFTCRNGVWEQTETSLFGCGGTTLPNTTEQAPAALVNTLQGQCVESTNTQGQYLKAQGPLITSPCAPFTSTIVLTTLITTTEMTWGLPWWAWLLICTALLLLCGLAAAAAAALLNRPKPKSAPREMITETQWVVEDVLDDDEAGFQGPSDRSMLAAQPTATTPMLPQQGSSRGY